MREAVLDGFAAYFFDAKKSRHGNHDGIGTPDAARTHDLQSRSLTLYPTELRARISWRPIYYNRKAGKSKERKEEDFSERERASGGRKVLKKGKEKNFEKMLFFSKKGVDKTGRAWYYK